jgi:GNAT superfamily N-acetyltransferase
VRDGVKGTRVEPVAGELPTGFGDLRADAKAEGHRFVDRLAVDWVEGAMRFDRRGELLLAAYVDRELAGIGGLTIEPLVPNALRMRRFYVRPSHRRNGAGRQLALALLEHGKEFTELVTVNAQEASFPFWESLGFIREGGDGLTHARDLTGEALR